MKHVTAAWYGAKCLALALATALTSAAAAEVKIGTAGPMSGQFDSLGTQMRIGAEQAVADLNAAGGVLGHNIVLEIGDDACDRKDADATANQMAGRGIVFMAGHLCSQPSIAAAIVYAEERIIQISPAATHPDFTDNRPGPGILRLANRDDDQGRVAGALLASRFADRNIAIVHDGTAYGKNLADSTRRAMNDAGKIESLSEDFEPGERDFVQLVSRLRAFGIDVLFLGGKHLDAGLLVTEMRIQGLDTTLVAGDALATEEFWNIAGVAGEGTLMTFPADPLENPDAADIVARFAERGVVAEGYVLPTYAAVQTWAQAAEAAGTFDFDPVVAALATGRFETVLGDVLFDESGDARLTRFVVYEWHDGAYSTN